MREPPSEQLLQELLYVNTPETIYNPEQWASDLTGLWPIIYLDFGKDAATATNFRACITQPRKWETLWESLGWPTPVVISRAFFLFFPCNHIINIKKKSFSGEAKDSVIFSFYIFLHKRAKPIHPRYIHPSAHLSTHTSTPSLVRRRRRRILLPCFANAKPLPEAGNNNYLGSECDHLPEAGNNNYPGSECDHLPEAGNIYIYWYPFLYPPIPPQPPSTLLSAR
jgi:hypothetical protein